MWASNSYSDVNERFSQFVRDFFGGIGASENIDAHAKKEEAYKEFLRLMQYLVSVVGGNPELNKKLTDDPTNRSVFDEWVRSVAEEPDVTSLAVDPLWILMRGATMTEVRNAAGMVEDAYNYIVTHSQLYKTAVVFDIQSDCTSDLPQCNSPFTYAIQGPNSTSYLLTQSSFQIQKTCSQMALSHRTPASSGARRIVTTTKDKHSGRVLFPYSGNHDVYIPSDFSSSTMVRPLISPSRMEAMVGSLGQGKR